jgi:hypothetical protein
MKYVPAARPLCLALVAVAANLASTTAIAATVAQWTFEAPNTPADANNVATYPNAIAPAVGAGNAGGVHASASTVWSTPAGNGSNESFSSNNWAIGDYYQFTTSTAGFFDLKLAWDQTSSNTGPRDFKLAYSTDGTTFVDFASYSVLANASPNPAWNPSTGSPLYAVNQDLSNVSVLDNQTSVFFRLVVTSTVSANGGALAAAGTGRVDNFSVMATPVPEPETYALLLAGLGLVGRAVSRRRKHVLA